MSKQQADCESDSSDISLEMEISCSDTDSDPSVNSGDDSDYEFHDAMDHIIGAGYRFEPEAAEEISETRGATLSKDIVEEEISADRLLSTEW